MQRLSGLFLATAITLTGCTPSSQSDVSNDRSASKTVNFVTDVVYGHSFGLALTFDVYVPANANANGAGVILTNSGGWFHRF
jgi:hypothetical protein